MYSIDQIQLIQFFETALYNIIVHICNSTKQEKQKSVGTKLSLGHIWKSYAYQISQLGLIYSYADS